ncbi:NAD(P)/FAD-dependent oxidoreductase [Hyphomonas sp.]|uniref:NAD(P)/FAD-dependent oxidoreductase n=1 Tax=Hyphomonas sp. TaxID=87 RepID=UPI003456D6DC
MRKHRLPDQCPPHTLTAPAPMVTAISTAGGVPPGRARRRPDAQCSDDLTCTGKMIAWDAPMGGYLLTACLAKRARGGARGFARQLNASLAYRAKAGRV